MAKTNLVISNGLEDEAEELRSGGSTYQEIADTLTERYGKKFSRSCIFRFFNEKPEMVRSIVEKKEELQLKVAEAEIDTLAYRKEIIEGLVENAKNADRPQDISYAYKIANEALDSYMKSIGKFAPTNQININNTNVVGRIEELSDEELAAIISGDQEV